MQKQKGLSLMQVFGVVALVGGLILIAAPWLMPARQQEGDRRVRLVLRQLCARQKAFFEKNKYYSEDLKQLGWSATESGDSLNFERFPYHFLLDVKDGQGEFQIMALEKEEQDRDGKLEVWVIAADCTPRLVED